MAVPKQLPTMPARATPPTGTNAPVFTDKAFIATCAEYVACAKAESTAEKRRKVLKKEIEARLGDSPIAYAGRHVIVVTPIPAIPGTPDQYITRAMIGQVLPGSSGRTGYNQLVVR